MEFLELVGLLGLVFLVGILLELCWSGYPLWNARRRRRIIIDEAHNCVTVMQVSTHLKVKDRSQGIPASEKRNTRLAA